MNVYHIGYFESKEKEDVYELSSMRILATDEMHAEMKFRYAVGDEAKFVYKIDERYMPSCNSFPKCK